MTGIPKELSAERLAEINKFIEGPTGNTEWEPNFEDEAIQALKDHRDHIDALTARIAELTKPIGQHEVGASVHWLRIPAEDIPGHEIDGIKFLAADILDRLAREVAALKVERDEAIAASKHFEQAADNYLEQHAAMSEDSVAAEARAIAAEQALESARKAISQMITQINDGMDQFAKDIGYATLARLKVTP